MKMEVLVRGTVARKVTVEGNSIAECEAKAFCEWADYWAEVENLKWGG